MKLVKLTLLIMVVLLFITACSSNFMQTVIGTNESKSKRDYAGKVNGHTITEEEFVRSFMGHFEGFTVRTNRKPSDEEKRKIYAQTWDDIVKHFVLIDLFKENNITTTMPEVMDSLLTNVPRIMKESPLFNEFGEFNYYLYEKCLRENDPIDLGWLKADYYKYKIPLKKLKVKAYASTDMNPDELKDAYSFYYTSVDSKVIYLNPESVKTVVINAEVDAYYNKNIRKYFIPASCDIAFTKFPVIPTDEDEENARFVADSLFTEINSGAVFSHLASKYSMHGSKSNDGSLGFVKLANLPTNVVKAINKTPVSSFTRPLKNGDDWSIYLVEDKTKTMVKLRLIRIKPRAGDKAYAMIDEMMQNVTELSKTIGLENATAEYDMQAETAKGLTVENDVIPDLGKSTTLIKQMLRKSPGTVLDPIKHQNDKAFILIEVTDSRPSSYVPVETVKSEIEDTLLKEKKERLAFEQAERLIDSFKGKRIIETAVKAGYEVIDMPNLTYESTVHNIDSTILIQDILNLKSDNTSTRPVVLEDGVYLGYAQSIQRPNPKNISLVRRELFERLSSEENDRFFDTWLEKKISDAKVVKWFNDNAFNPE